MDLVPNLGITIGYPPLRKYIRRKYDISAVKKLYPLLLRNIRQTSLNTKKLAEM
jgi:hypothetical protein